ncbi:MAG TPA: acyltransferase family protein [Gallionella sp.]|nr:acyltransferase family protein [Gallionella sp.]
MQLDKKSKSQHSETIAAPESTCTPALTGALPGKSDYRPDIDGLRAIAVLSVVVFHAFPSLLPGGFAGVDIFFVISGFLISKHIWEELGASAFSIRTFYARRIRRIFPALGVVLLACLAMGWVILTPAEYEQLGKHVVAGAIFVSNIILWKESGYFDNAADTKPLLHLWSLGIEEQFYIVWPLLLAFFWRYTRHFGWALLGIIGVSLAYSMMVVRHDAVADFYSPLTRFWELALGAGLVYLVTHKPTVSAMNRSLVSWLGLCLILASAVVIEKHYAFPGAWALLPTMGAACLIYAEGTWPNRRVLSHHLLVWFGLISYPLYLWHWPLLSFARIMESGTPSVEVRFWLVAASIILAWLTYKLLERPVRSRPRSLKIVLILCLAMLLLGVAGLTVKKLDGFKSRQFSMLNADPDTLALGADRGRLQNECGITEAQKSIFQYCLRSGPEEPRYALLGDSKGEAFFYGLVRESKPDMQWVMIGSVYPSEPDGASEDRQQLKNRLALQTIVHNPSIKVVALAVALRGIFPLNSDTGFIGTNAAPSPGKIASYSRTIQQLEQAGKRVVFIIDNPTFPDPRSCISGGATSSPFLNQFLRRKENPHCTIRHTDHLAGTQAYRQFIGELKRLHPSLTVYDPTPLLCDIPRNVCAITHEGKFLYSYGDHISDYANSMIARDMLPVIRELAR